MRRNTLLKFEKLVLSDALSHALSSSPNFRRALSEFVDITNTNRNRACRVSSTFPATAQIKLRRQPIKLHHNHFAKALAKWGHVVKGAPMKTPSFPRTTHTFLPQTTSPRCC